MSNEIQTISYINLGDGQEHPIDAVSVGGKLGENIQVTNNLVTSVNSSSSDTQYPSAKCIYTLIGNIETLLSNI